MTHSRQVHIGIVPEKLVAFLKDRLYECATKGSVSVYVHEAPQLEFLGPPVDITVDVWSENEGSVNDFVGFYLCWLERDHSRCGICDASQEYRDRVDKWLRDERQG